MKSKLVKAWGPYAAGMVVVDNKAEEAATTGAIRVNPERFAKLHEDGFLEVETSERPIPSEVRMAGAGDEDAANRPIDEEGAEAAFWGSDEAVEYSDKSTTSQTEVAAEQTEDVAEGEGAAEDATAADFEAPEKEP